MAEHHARSFFEKVNANADMRERIRAASAGAAGEIVKIGLEHGHEFTHEELRKVLIEAWGTGEMKSAPGEDDPSTCFFVSERPGE